VYRHFGTLKLRPSCVFFGLADKDPHITFREACLLTRRRPSHALGQAPLAVRFADEIYTDSICDRSDEKLCQHVA
jgi:hypothetical protein